MKFKLLTVICMLYTGQAYTQNPLNFEQALELTLAGNYNIVMASLSEEIAENNASKANNNYLPTVSANGAYNWTYYEGENRLISETRTFDANNSYNYSASAVVNYTLFNGQGRRYAYLQSKENLTLSRLHLKQVIQNTILELSNIYHEVARLEESVISLEKAVEISKDRLTRANYRYDYGQANKLEILNARVDLNADSISLIRGKQDLETMKRNLNYIMGQEVSNDISVNNEVQIRKNITLNEVELALEENNLDIKLADSRLEINRYAIGASKANWLPSIGANAGYLYRGSEDPNGAFLIGSANYGPQAGLSLNWTLFDGRNNTAVQNAKIRLENSMVEQQSLKQSAKSEGLNAFTNYTNLLFILRSQTDNVATAEDNFNRSEDAYNRGQINSVEFRQAQLNLLNAEQALSRAKYDAKNAELRVLAAMGILVK